MSDNVFSLPQEQPLDPLFGPFNEYRVVVDGRAIPKMTGYHEGEKTWLVVDGRFGIGVPKELAQQVAWLAAQAMAVGAGYSHLGATTKEMPFAPEVMDLGDVQP